jgi:hypothetical protein
VEGAFRHAPALESAARALEGAMRPETPVPVLTRLVSIREVLGTTARALSGKTSTVPAASPPGTLPETPVQQRARLALALLVRARPQIVAFAHAIGGSSRRAGPAAASEIGRESRVLLRGARALRAELRRLLAVRSTFVR